MWHLDWKDTGVGLLLHTFCAVSRSCVIGFVSVFDNITAITSALTSGLFVTRKVSNAAATLAGYFDDAI